MLDLVEKFICEFVKTEVHTRLFSTIPNQEKKKMYVWWWVNMHSQAEPWVPTKIKGTYKNKGQRVHGVGGGGASDD